jgi:flagellar hook protein FlgE
MSIYSSLYSGVSGLTALGNAMSVIGDNIANVNTTGFKSSRATFEDVLNMTITTGNGTAQVGQGTMLSDVSSTFAQAGFETTDSVTDLAIEGEGFFVVNDGNQNLYTRAGAFTIDSELQMVNSAGYIVQGRKLDANTGAFLGGVTDITIDQTTIAPSKTDTITIINNLDSREVQSAGALAWDATDADGDGNYISENAYTHSSTVKVYDQQGNTHDVTIYFDKSADDGEGANNTWNYIVTINPDEDTVGDGATQGLLGTGTLTFDDEGKISSIQLEETDPEEGDELLKVSVDFLGGEATAMDIFLDFGAAWNANLGDAGAWVSDTLTTTQYSSSSVNMFQSTTGFARGELQDLRINTDGIITGLYSNGKNIPLYQLTLAKFNNLQGLEKIGGSLFRETTESGLPTLNEPQTNGLGKISSSALEQSNVDIATEFVKMITTQRGFQANSKTITTTDEMIQAVVNLKR